uniref:Uncharacterized protein n=1 Tax=Rhizophagus irregularis (strain DAOM 181602 / DAOM 197198 / MUCL 43194) TaxID=747089 RepID=U9TBT6_RHIID
MRGVGFDYSSGSKILDGVIKRFQYNPVLHYTMKYSRNDPNELMDFLIGYEDLCFSTVV